MKRNVVIVIVLLVGVLLPCFAKKAHAPLPPQLVAAKTVCISMTTSQDLRDKAFQEITKTKYFAFVTDCSTADLVFSFEIHDAGYSGGYSQRTIVTPINPSGEVYHPGHTDYEEDFSVADSKGTVLWKDDVGITKYQIRNLIKRIKEQSK